MDNIVKLNVGGTKFYTKTSTLQKHPETRLGQLNFQSQEYIAEKQFFFFDRNPEFFNIILDFYRNGSVHLPSGICSALMEMELVFWGIPFNNISECCRSNILSANNELETIKNIKDVFGNYDTSDVKNVVNSKWSYLHKLWLFLEEPVSSRPAKIYNIFYILVVLLSVIMTFLLYYPGFRTQYIDIETLMNNTGSDNIGKFLDTDNPKAVYYATTYHPAWWSKIDWALLGYFTLEFALRLIACPNKLAFFKNWLNIVDIFLNLFMWTRFGLERNLSVVWKSVVVAWILSISYCVVSLRLLRIFRIGKQFSELQIMMMSMRDSARELLLMLFCFLVMAVFYANIIFYAEYHEPTTFQTPFAGLWWAVVTMTTVGYGDVVPKSTLGKIIGSACAIEGMLMLAMPLAIIATKFNAHYQKMKDIQKFNKIFPRKTQNKQLEYNDIYTNSI